MTQTLSKEAAEGVLEKHSLGLTKVIAAGWSRWRELVKQDPGLGSILSNRSRASIVSDCIRHEALVVFDGAEDVTVSEDRGFLLLTFNEKIILRFKKFRGATLRTSSVPTQQALEYAAQTLPGMESLTHLVAGYLPDEVGIDLKKAAITCPEGNGVNWIIELDLTKVVGDVTEQRDLAAVAHVETDETKIGTIVRPRRPEHETDTEKQASSER
ncbi:hypothetical protein [Streptomyces sp. CBMA29]|uniref:hypothetical protein n=1 Tax=Streptomyces sp. CBMA29 TaxID=1896314 RepID=UPI001661E5E0|nr:hypothetical protein [Streptomyces sp. CBMA29]MBD0735284.1 hypothetical protein [Streptomyces sp. CBMA29]